MSARWTAIVLAGQRPGENAFAEAHGTGFKALIPVAGEPMLGRVARTLLASPSIERIVILAQEPQDLLGGPLAWMAGDDRISTARSGDGISRSIGAVAGTAAAPFPLLVTTADHALLTPAMVEEFLAQAAQVDVAVGVVERRVVETRFPDTRRTWISFRGGQYSGANLFALRTSLAQKALDVWAGVERDRKKAARLLLYFGPFLALRALTRTISLDHALQRVGAQVGLEARAVRLPFAEAAVDVDKQSDLELAEMVLLQRPD